MSRIEVTIVSDDCSKERDVSVKSAIETTTNIDTEKFDPHYIGITKNGVWRLCREPCTEQEIDSLPTVLSPNRKTYGLPVTKESEYEIRRVDMAFPALRGKCGGGEDGTIQGLFVLSSIPYVSCDIQSSIACMNKSLTYIPTKNAGITAPEFQAIDEGNKPEAGALTCPVFVKLAWLDSFFGVTRVNNTEELNVTIEAARQYSGGILIRQAISGCEVGYTAIGSEDDLIVDEMDRTRLSHDTFHIHQENEPERGSKSAIITIPTDIPAEE